MPKQICEGIDEKSPSANQHCLSEAHYRVTLLPSRVRSYFCSRCYFAAQWGLVERGIDHQAKFRKHGFRRDPQHSPSNDRHDRAFARATNGALRNPQLSFFGGAKPCPSA